MGEVSLVKDPYLGLWDMLERLGNWGQVPLTKVSHSGSDGGTM